LWQSQLALAIDPKQQLAVVLAILMAILLSYYTDSNIPLVVLSERACRFKYTMGNASS
jgi:hypothetical protein